MTETSARSAGVRGGAMRLSDAENCACMRARSRRSGCGVRCAGRVGLEDRVGTYEWRSDMYAATQQRCGHGRVLSHQVNQGEGRKWDGKLVRRSRTVVRCCEHFDGAAMDSFHPMAARVRSHRTLVPAVLEATTPRQRSGGLPVLGEPGHRGPVDDSKVFCFDFGRWLP